MKLKLRPYLLPEQMPAFLLVSAVYFAFWKSTYRGMVPGWKVAKLTKTQLHLAGEMAETTRMADEELWNDAREARERERRCISASGAKR